MLIKHHLSSDIIINLNIIYINWIEMYFFSRIIQYYLLKLSKLSHFSELINLIIIPKYYNNCVTLHTFSKNQIFEP